MANWASIARLGDPSTPEWQAQNLAWIEPIKGQRWQVYKPAEAAFTGLLTDLAALGYHPISSGGYNYRNIRGSPNLSQHAFGTAIDLNAMTNPMGQSASDIPHAAELAKKWGLEWGGNWQGRPDPMHFEYTGQGDPNDPQQKWISGLWQYAQAAGQKTGIDPRLIMAQAALETGYGKSAPNYNYFGIKGPGATQQTLEYINGKMQPVQAGFRTYKSPEESFQDYANVLMGERYAGVRGGKNLEEQAAALGKSGYATDPDYAAKVMKIAQGLPQGGYGTTASGGVHPPNPSVGAGGYTAPGANTTMVAQAIKPKTAKQTFGEGIGKALEGGLAGMAGAGAPQGGWQPNIPQMPQQAPVPIPAMATAISPFEGQGRDQLAALMQRLNQGTLW